MGKIRQEPGSPLVSKYMCVHPGIVRFSERVMHCGDVKWVKIRQESGSALLYTQIHDIYIYIYIYIYIHTHTSIHAYTAASTNMMYTNAC